MTRGTARLLAIVAILGGAAALAAAMFALRQTPPKRDIDTRPMLVDVLELERISTRFEVRSRGTVQPKTQTVLSAEVSGAIVDISPKFNAGGVFQADEVLLRIDPTDYEVAVRQSDALVKQRTIEYDGAKKLRNQGYRAESEYASAAAALASAEAELVRARRNLERTYIRLPYEGIVLSKEADLGQFVSPGTRLGVTFATDYAEVRLPLTDQDLAFVELPGAAEIAATGDSNGPSVTLSAMQKGRYTEWRARIVRSEGVVDEKSRVTYAVARVEDPYRLHGSGAVLPVGTFVAASLEGTTVQDVIRVPRSALRGSNELLFVDADNQLRIRAVDIVRADAEYAYVGAGAAPGERITVTTIESPINGMRVRTTDDVESDRQVASTSEEDDG